MSAASIVAKGERAKRRAASSSLSRRWAAGVAHTSYRSREGKNEIKSHFEVKDEKGLRRAPPTTANQDRQTGPCRALVGSQRTVPLFEPAAVRRDNSLPPLNFVVQRKKTDRWPAWEQQLGRDYLCLQERDQRRGPPQMPTLAGHEYSLVEKWY